ncbi:MAG: DUF4438 domain-containing protein [Candidatus Caldatribacteriota bacterium]|nr:DUF4438 domain-containing protein [Candidatus Caldatribacteriota bacterium]
MLKTNKDKLVMMSIQGRISYPVKRGPYRVTYNGKPVVVPGVGGITYNIKVGDCAFGWEADHVEPGVSTVVNEEKRDEGPNIAYNILACIGNKARIVSGEAKGMGELGTVTGHHGGIEHVLIDFDQKTLEKLSIGDKILIKSFGQGLKLLDYPDIKVFNLDPDFLEKLTIKETDDGVIDVPVTCEIPAKLMGSGLGSASVASGDYDITTADKSMVKKYKLDKIKFGDIVAISDADNSFGRSYKEGAVSIGIVIHSDCVLAGHGPGVTTLLTSINGKIKFHLNADANIANYLNIGTKRK